MIKIWYDGHDLVVTMHKEGFKSRDTMCIDLSDSDISKHDDILDENSTLWLEFEEHIKEYSPTDEKFFNSFVRNKNLLRLILHKVNYAMKDPKIYR
jgi:hypothetical protein